MEKFTLNRSTAHESESEIKEKLRENKIKICHKSIYLYECYRCPEPSVPAKFLQFSKSLTKTGMEDSARKNSESLWIDNNLSKDDKLFKTCVFAKHFVINYHMKLDLNCTNKMWHLRFVWIGGIYSMQKTQLETWRRVHECTREQAQMWFCACCRTLELDWTFQNLNM